MGYAWAIVVGGMGTVTETATKRRSNRIVTFGCLGLIAAVLVIVLVNVLGGASASPAQKRAAFTAAVKHLEGDVAYCNAAAADAVVALGEAVKGTMSPSQAHKVADQAASACDPASDNAILDLGTYSPPSDLSGLGFGSAAQDLSVWAQEDVEPAMKDIASVMSNPNDAAAASDFKSHVAGSAQDLASANAVLERIAEKLGVGNFKPISLTPL